MNPPSPTPPRTPATATPAGQALPAPESTTPAKWRRGWPYLGAVGLSLATLALRLAAGETLGDYPTLIVFSVPIVISALWGGFFPGLLATALAIGGAAYFIFAPVGSFFVEQPVSRWQLISIAIPGVLFSVVGELQRRMRRNSDSTIRNLQAKERALQHALQETREVRAALDAHALVVITDAEGRVTYLNDKVSAASKYSREELMGRNLRMLNSGHHSKEFFREMWMTISAGRVWHGDMKNRAKDGSHYWVATTIVPLLDANGKPHHYMAIRADITAQKRNEEALRAAERRLLDATEAGRIGLWDWELDSGKIRWSPMHATLWGLDIATFRGTYEEFAEPVLPEDRERIAAQLSAALAEHRMYQHEYRLRLRDGTTRWILGRGKGEYDASGKPVRMSGMVADITAVKELERAVRDSEARFTAYLNGIPARAWIKDAAGRYQFVNTLWQKGAVSAAEAIGRTCEEVMPPTAGRAIREKDEEVLASGTAMEFLEHFDPAQGPDGRGQDWRTIRFPFSDSSGQRLLGGFALDVTERERAKAALARAIALQDAILAAAPYAIIACDVEGRIESFNRGAEKMLGYTSAEMLGELPSRFHDSSEIAERAAQLTAEHGRRIEPGMQVFMLGTESAGYEQRIWTYIRKDGSRFPVELVVAPRLSPKREVVGWLGIAMDITDRLAAEENLRTANRMLRDLSRQRERVREEERTNIAREIHDVLAQELTRVKIDLVWLAKRMAALEADGQLAAVRSRLDDAIRQTDTAISTVQRIATELRPVILDSLGLAAAVEWQTEDFSRRTGIACRVSAPINDAAVGRERATALFRILQEALTNVARHAAASEVQVHLVHRARAVQLTVRDNGCGISPDRLRDPRSIGLMGMRERAQAYGGTVDISLATGGGTLLSACLPLEAEAPLSS